MFHIIMSGRIIEMNKLTLIVIPAKAGIQKRAKGNPDINNVGPVFPPQTVYNTSTKKRRVLAPDRLHKWMPDQVRHDILRNRHSRESSWVTGGGNPNAYRQDSCFRRNDSIQVQTFIERALIEKYYNELITDAFK
jgi:hypothetical protein